MQDFIQDDIEIHRQAYKMSTDLEVITLREASQTALEVTFLQIALQMKACSACHVLLGCRFLLGLPQLCAACSCIWMRACDNQRAAATQAAVGCLNIYGSPDTAAIRGGVRCGGLQRHRLQPPA